MLQHLEKAIAFTAPLACDRVYSLTLTYDLGLLYTSSPLPFLVSLRFALCIFLCDLGIFAILLIDDFN